MANIICGGTGNKTGCNKKREPSKATTNISANYLQVVTNNTLEDQVGLSICMVIFPFLFFYQKNVY